MKLMMVRDSIDLLGKRGNIPSVFHFMLDIVLVLMLLKSSSLVCLFEGFIVLMVCRLEIQIRS